MTLLLETVRDRLLTRIANRTATVGIVGLGYVGLPLAIAFAQSGFQTVGLDIDQQRVRSINGGRSGIEDVTDRELTSALVAERFIASADPEILSDCDCVVICVPTPLTTAGEPDLSCVREAVAMVKEHVRDGQLIVLESTTYPGCTDELVRTELESTGRKLDRDFLLAFSPERVDPGNGRFKTADIPRIVGGCSADSALAAKQLYLQVVPHVHLVSSARAAETAKLLENTFRAVNIGLVNEVAIMCRRMNVDIWEVIEAAKTKPYGFMPFYPGPGVGGHCIPVDPAYLGWRARELGIRSSFIEAAERVNASMPAHVVELVTDALNDCGKPVRDARVLLVGVSYKKDVADVRESPAIPILAALRAKNARVSYHDPFVPRFENLESQPLTGDALLRADCVVILTDHSSIDVEQLAQSAALVVDTRHAITEDLRRNCRAQVVRL